MRITGTIITCLLIAFLTYEICSVITEHHFVIVFVSVILALILSFIINTDNL